jgi:LysM repeat protein
LFQRLGQLQCGGRQLGHLQQGLGAKSIEPNVLPVQALCGPGGLRVPTQEWDWCPAEVQGLVIGACNQFNQIGVVRILISLQGAGHGSDPEVGVLIQGIGQLPYRGRIKEGLVALYIHHYVRWIIPIIQPPTQGLGAAIGAAGVGVAGYANPGVKALYVLEDALIVSGHQHLGSPESFGSQFAYTANHTFTVNHHQRLTWKAGRCISGRNYCKRFHIFAVQMHQTMSKLFAGFMMCWVFAWYQPALASPFTGDSLQYLRAKDTVFLRFNAWEEKVFPHKLESKQTLYSLARFYGLKLDELYRYNPALRDNEAPEVGTEVEVPIPNRAILRFMTEGFKQAEYAPVFYVVRKGDTLYRISKEYFKMPMDTLIARNQLAGVDLREGQLLQVGWFSLKGVEPPDSKGAEAAPAPGAQAMEQQYRQQLEQGKTEVKHQGAAFWDKQTRSSTRNEFYVLHREAAIGSVLAITNPMTRRTVYAKVVGRIPDHYGSHILVVISPGIAEMLGALDATFFSQIRYCR